MSSGSGRLGHFQDLTGSKFTRLTAKWSEGRNHRTVMWLCLCVCGNTVHTTANALLRKRTKSCGCYNRDRSRIGNRRHGHSTRLKGLTPEYRSYSHAKARCENTVDAKYPYYGGRGIEFRFKSFQEFFAELGKKPSRAHSVHRIDNDGHYEAGNVKWATAKEQCTNKRRWGTVSRRK
jgi:hypothetical protein